MRKNILRDDKYQNGFMLKGLNSLSEGQKSKRDIILNEKEKPSWYICQWNSKYNLVNDGKIIHDKDYFEIKDISKRMVFDGKKVTFSLDASKEYEHDRKANEPWPHLLIEQDIEPNKKIRDIKSLSINGTFELEEHQSFMENSDRNLHTSQFVFVLVLKNINEKSKDYNRFVWIVFSIFDSRYKHAPLFCSQDSAVPNGEWIYSFSSDEYMPNLLELNKAQEIHFDVYPRLEKILSLAKQNGFFNSTSIDDVALTGMNIGFEITGTYKSTISVSDLQILVEDK